MNSNGAGTGPGVGVLCQMGIHHTTRVTRSTPGTVGRPRETAQSMCSSAPGVQQRAIRCVRCGHSMGKATRCVVELNSFFDTCRICRNLSTLYVAPHTTHMGIVVGATQSLKYPLFSHQPIAVLDMKYTAHGSGSTENDVPLPANRLAAKVILCTHPRNCTRSVLLGSQLFPPVFTRDKRTVACVCTE